jgi:phospholipid-binding lipoprotein MlaA
MGTANRESATCLTGRPWIGVLCASFFLTLLIGCSSTPGDPLEKFNRAMYGFNEGLDRHALKPAAHAYVKVIPHPVRTGVGNFFSNLGTVNVIINDLLQAKWRQGLDDTGRLAFNSTIGVAGILDPATKWGLPAHENGLGTTLGKWGVRPGPYLVIPVLGPSTVRDATNIPMAIVTDPIFWFNPEWYVTIPLAALDAVDQRSRIDFLVRFRSETALDPYVFTRDAYLQYREGLIRSEKASPGEDIYDEDLGPTTGSTTHPANSTSSPTTTAAN